MKRVCDFLGVDSSIKLPFPPNYSSPSVIDRGLQVELRAYFGDRFPEIVEHIRKEEDISVNTLSIEDAMNIKRLKSNLREGKDAIPEVSYKRLRDLLHDEIISLKNLVNFQIDDWL